MLEESVSKYVYPDGPYWSKDAETLNYTPFKGCMAANFTPFN
jgi:hypothetical protein